MNAEGGPAWRRFLVLVVALLGAFVVVVDNLSMTVAVGAVANDLQVSRDALQLVVAGYPVVFASLLIAGGRMCDLIGARWTMAAGGLSYGIGSAICAGASDLEHLLLGKVLFAGIGAALMFPCTVSVLSSNFTGHMRSFAFSCWGATSGLAVCLGPAVGGYFATYHSWRGTFVASSTIALTVAAGSSWVLSGLRRRNVHIDVAGVAFAAAPIFLAVFALGRASEFGWWRPLKNVKFAALTWKADFAVSLTPVMLLIAAALSIGFLRHEGAVQRRGIEPLVRPALLRDRGMGIGLATTLLSAMGQLGSFYVLSTFFQGLRDLTPSEAGVRLLPIGIFILIASQVTGQLTRTFSITGLVRVGLAVHAAGLTMLAVLLREDVSSAGLLPAFIAVGCGMGITNAQLANLVVLAAPSNASGVAGGMVSTARQIGTAVGLAVIGAIVAQASNGIDALAASRRGMGLPRLRLTVVVTDHAA